MSECRPYDDPPPGGDADPLDAIDGNVTPTVRRLWLALAAAWTGHGEGWQVDATRWRDTFLTGDDEPRAIRLAEALLDRAD